MAGTGPGPDQELLAGPGPGPEGQLLEGPDEELLAGPGGDLLGGRSLAARGNLAKKSAQFIFWNSKLKY